jgi:hypothetical protein
MRRPELDTIWRRREIGRLKSATNTDQMEESIKVDAVELD